MERAIFLKLLSRKLAAELSAKELQQLAHATNTQPELQRLEEEVTRYFQAGPQQAVDVEAKLEKVWASIAAREQEPELVKTVKISHFNGRNLLRYAAAVLVLVLAGFAIRSFWPKTPAEPWLTLNSGREKLYVTLADGTQVWLNRQSSISYNADFGQRQRQITLKGEAFFDVVKNPAVPLTVEAGHINIKVKGTAFNVQANDPAKKVEVALLRGLIEVTDDLGESGGILLKPNHKLVFDDKTDVGHAHLLTLDAAATATTLKWTQDTLLFRKEKLKDLALQLEIRYKVKIEIQNEQLKNKRFSGTFTNEPLRDALEALRLSYPFNYQITEDKVVIR